MKKVVVILILLWSCGPNRLSNLSKMQNEHNENILCRGTVVSLSLVENFKKIYEPYEEGYFQTFAFKDSSVITIQCGSMVNIPILFGDLYNLTLEKKNENFESRYGTKSNNRFWREDKYYNKFIIFYDNVKFEDKKLFDSFLDNLILKTTYN